MRNPTLFIASVLGALAVGLGAFGAHSLGLEGRPEEIYQTAVQYHFYHVLALLAVAQPALPLTKARRLAITVLLAAGILLFCGSLYALAVGAPRVLGAVTPLGGVCFIVGWGLLAFSALTNSQR